LAPSTAVVIAAAGRGHRAGCGRATASSTQPPRGGDAPKQWAMLGGAPLVVHSFRFFDRLPEIDRIVVGLDAESLDSTERRAFLGSAHGKKVQLVAGGSHRQETVWRALQALQPAPEIVLIHDAARPFPPLEAVRECMAAAGAHGGAILARPVTETVKRVDDRLRVVETPERRTLWAAQTPQGFRYAELVEAYRQQADCLADFSDDAGIFEAWGGCVQIVPAPPANLKVTLPEDFERAEKLLKARGRQEPGGVS